MNKLKFIGMLGLLVSVNLLHASKDKQENSNLINICEKTGIELMTISVPVWCAYNSLTLKNVGGLAGLTSCIAVPHGIKIGQSVLKYKENTGQLATPLSATTWSAGAIIACTLAASSTLSLDIKDAAYYCTSCYAAFVAAIAHHENNK